MAAVKMSLLLCSALVGIRLRNAYVLLGVLFVDLCRECGLPVKGAHLLIDVLPVVVGHLHTAIKVIKSAVRHF